jgi:hypothetical protein
VSSTRISHASNDSVKRPKWNKSYKGRNIVSVLVRKHGLWCQLSYNTYKAAIVSRWFRQQAGGGSCQGNGGPGGGQDVTKAGGY